MNIWTGVSGKVLILALILTAAQGKIRKYSLKNKYKSKRPETYIFRTSSPKALFWQILRKSDFSILHTLSRFLQQTALKALTVSKTENEVKFFTSSLLVQSFSWQNEESDHRRKDVLIFRQILFTSAIWNVWRKLRRICIMISALKRSKIETVWQPFGYLYFLNSYNWYIFKDGSVTENNFALTAISRSTKQNNSVKKMHFFLQ